MPDEGDLLEDRYRLRRRIGTGPYGTVWELFDEEPGDDGRVTRLCVGKQYDRLRAMREAQYPFRLERTWIEAARGVRLAGHPCIAAPRRLVVDRTGMPWLVSDHVAGTALSEHLRSYGPVPWQRAAQLAADLLEAYTAYTVAELVHRNIRPSNIILTRGGRAVLTDFAPPIHPVASLSFAHAPHGERLEQFEHLAPERLRGHDAPVSDLFAIGTVVFRALDGQGPFRHATPAEALRALLNAAPPPWPEQAGALTPLLLGLIDPDFRTRIGVERAKELLAWARSAAAASPQDAVPAPVPRVGMPDAVPPQDAVPAPMPQDALPAPVPQDAVPAPAPQDAVPQDAVPVMPVVPQIAVPQHFLPQSAIPQGVVPEEFVPQLARPQQGVLRRNVPWAGVPMPDGPGDAIARTVGSSDAEPQDAVPYGFAARAESAIALVVPQGGIACLAFTPDGTSLAGAMGPAELHRWELGAQPSVAPLHHLTATPGPRSQLDPRRSGPARALAFGTGGLFLASGGPDNRVRTWRPVKYETRQAVEAGGFAGPVSALAIDPTSVYLAAADRTAVWLCEPASGARRRLDRSAPNATALAFAPDGALLAAADQTGIHLAETWTGQALGVVARCGPVDCLAFSHDGRLLAASVPGGALLLYDTTSWTLRQQLESGSGSWPVAALAFTRDGRLVAAVAGRSTLELRLWSL